MIALSNIIDNWLTGNVVPDHIAVLTRDLMAYKKRSPHMKTACINVGRDSNNSNGFMTVCYHNKGIEMIDLPRLLNSKTVKDAVPHFREPPMLYGMPKLYSILFELTRCQLPICYAVSMTDLLTIVWILTLY